MARTSLFRPGIILALFTFVGALVTFTGGLQNVNINEIEADGLDLSVDEEAYYEYVSPRLERLVTEVAVTREMVETKSRDIVALTRAGSIIDTLTTDIRGYGEANGVPSKFSDVHARILEASDTVIYTFDEARTALRTFNFSAMSGLVVGFGNAADAFVACQDDLEALVR